MFFVSQLDPLMCLLFVCLALECVSISQFDR